MLVPVVRAAETLSFAELARRIAELAEACRAGTISVNDLRGANVLLTSVGKFGSSGGIPRLPVGPGCIIAAGRIAVPTGLEQLAESLPIDPVMLVTSTYDHRVIQGADSGTMLAGLATRLGSSEFLESLLPATPTQSDTSGAPAPREAAVVLQDCVVASVPNLDVEYAHLRDESERQWWAKQLSGEVRPALIRLLLGQDRVASWGPPPPPMVMV